MSNDTRQDIRALITLAGWGIAYAVVFSFAALIAIGAITLFVAGVANF